MALVSTAGLARNDDRPFDQDGGRRDPWWGDPSFREIPIGTTEKDVLYHMRIDSPFGEAAPTWCGRYVGLSRSPTL